MGFILDLLLVILIFSSPCEGLYVSVYEAYDRQGSVDVDFLAVLQILYHHTQFLKESFKRLFRYWLHNLYINETVYITVKTS